MDRAARRWARWWLGTTALAVALGACSAGDAGREAAQAPLTSTTAASTTTTSSPTTTTEDPEVAAVRDAHLAYLEMFELVGDPPDPDHPELARRATGDAYERLRANLTQDRVAGNRMVGEWDSSIQSITIEGDEATVEDCLLDALAVVDRNSSTIVAADRERFRRYTRLQRAGDDWKVWRLDIPEPAESCSA